ncbi:MAG: hypothetical protein HFG20_00665 [Anaerotruncus sp.]|jgi:medium-chain acyl-[acyl-carrier-protein] hydrolase|nr:hypothetical protein [Anaerotruncus sp.]
MALTCTRSLAVIEPECDIQRRMTLANIMRHAQQMGSYHLAELGLGYKRLYEDGMVFLVSKMKVTVNRRPEFDEQLQLVTIPKQPKGAQFIRDTIFKSAAGEKLIEVSIAWLLVEPEEHRILRPSVFQVYGLEMTPNDGESITGYRIRKPAQDGTLHMRQVKYSDLDYNGHVNNAIYANMIYDALPTEVTLQHELEEFGILYQKEAKLGQVIELEVIQMDEKGLAYYVGGKVEDGRCFEAEIKFQ